MGELLALAGENLISPIVLSFALGLFAALARSELSVPEAAAKLIGIEFGRLSSEAGHA